MSFKIEHNPHLGDIEEFLKNNEKLVDDICKRYAHITGRAGFEYDDLKSVGMFGLMKAYVRYNPASFENVTKFSTYGHPIIYGEISQFLRDNSSNMIKYPRSMKTLAYKINQMRKLEDLEKPSTIEDIAKMLSCSVQKVVDAISIIEGRESLQRQVRSDKKESVTIGDEILIIYSDFTNIYIEDFTDKLPTLWQDILKLRMERELHQREIGKIVGRSQIAISRILKKIGKAYLDYLEGKELNVTHRKYIKKGA